MEAARHEVDRHAPGRLVRRLPGAARDGHVLDRAGRHAGGRGHARVRARLASLAEGAAGRVRSSTRRRTGWRGCSAAAPPGEEVEIVPVVVKAGGCSFHHNLTWHGCASNTSAEVTRRALVSHMLAGRDAVPRGERRPDLLAVPAPRRPVDGRVVLPRHVGRERLPHALARGAPRHRRLIAGYPPSHLRPIRPVGTRGDADGRRRGAGHDGFAPGTGAVMSGPVARGELGQSGGWSRRSATFAVKEWLRSSPGTSSRSAAFQEAAAARAFPARRSGGGTTARCCSTWAGPRPPSTDGSTSWSAMTESTRPPSARCLRRCTVFRSRAGCRATPGTRTPSAGTDGTS